MSDEILAKITCFKCKEKGHYADKCPARKRAHIAQAATENLAPQPFTNSTQAQTSQANQTAASNFFNKSNCK